MKEMIFDELKERLLVSRTNKQSDIALIYSTLIGEIERAVTPKMIDGVKTYLNDEVQKVSKTMKNNLSIAYDSKPDDETLHYIKTLEVFLPKELTEKEI